MTQEEKELLLIDLSGRVRYGVRLWLKCFEKEPKYFVDGHNILGSVIYDRGSEYKISLIDKGEYNIEGHRFSNYEQVIKPYLRPMSSMTEEEEIAYPIEGAARIVDWLNAHYFDFRGLIPMGLALEAPDGMYNKKSETI